MTDATKETEKQPVQQTEQTGTQTADKPDEKQSTGEKTKKKSKKELLREKQAAEESKLTESEKKLRLEQRKRAQKKKRKKIIKSTIGILCVVGILGFMAWNYFSKQAAVASKPYDTYTVGKRDITVVLSGTGAVQPVKTYTVTAPVQGEIVEAPIVEGADVEKGDVLYKVDSADAETSIKNARNSLRNSQLSYNEVFEGYEDLVGTSDYSGTVTSLDVKVGDNVQSASIIGHIRDDETMLLKVPFFSSDIGKIAVGAYAEITIADYYQIVYGVVTEISSFSEVTATGARAQTVTVSVTNPGAITPTTTASAVINGISSIGNGTFEYNVDEDLKAGISGEVSYVAVKEGDKIYKGGVLVSASSEELDKQLEKAELSLDNARTSYDNALEKLEDYTITAPISGTVVEAKYNLGENIDSNSGFTMAIIYDMSQYTFEMSIDELDVVNVDLGQKVKITCDARDGSEYSGYISKISKQGATANGVTSYPVTITIEDPLALEELLPGMNVDAEIVVKQVVDVLSIPVDAVGRGNVVKVIKKDSVEKYGVNSAVTGGGTAKTDTQKSDATNVDTAKTDTQKSEATNGDTAKTDTQKFEATNGDTAKTDTQKSEATNGDTAKTDTSAVPTNNRGKASGGGSYGTISSESGYDEVRVTLGVSDDDFVEVTDGLSEGDVIIIEAMQFKDSFTAMMSMSGGGGPQNGGGPRDGGMR